MAGLTSSAHHSAKARDIIAAAQQLFGEVGYEKTGIRDIAERADIALGTLYTHFEDGKVGVLDAAIDERVTRLVGFVAEVVDADPLEAFLERIRRLNTELADDPFLRRLIADQSPDGEPRLRERGRQIASAFDSSAVNELRRLRAAGYARCDDPEATALLLRVTSLGWIASRNGPFNDVDHNRLLDALIAAVRALVGTGCA
jgi:AcrR family transcriptional regulator